MESVNTFDFKTGAVVIASAQDKIHDTHTHTHIYILILKFLLINLETSCSQRTPISYITTIFILFYQYTLYIYDIFRETYPVCVLLNQNGIAILICSYDLCFLIRALLVQI